MKINKKELSEGFIDSFIKRGIFKPVEAMKIVAGKKGLKYDGWITMKDVRETFGFSQEVTVGEFCDFIKENYDKNDIL